VTLFSAQKNRQWHNSFELAFGSGTPGPGIPEESSAQPEESSAQPVFSTKSFLFGGVDEYVSLPTTVTDTINGSGAASLSIWFKKSTHGNVETIFFLSTSTNWIPKFELHFTAGDRLQIRGRAGVGGATRTQVGTTDFTGDFDWHHVVATIDLTNSLMIMYIDGSLEFSSGKSFADLTFDTSKGNQNIAQLDGNRYFNGNVDEVILYDRVMTAPEVTALYNLGVPGDPDLTDATVFYRMGEDPLDDGTGGSGNIQDQIGSAHGTPTNTEGADIVDN